MRVLFAALLLFLPTHAAALASLSRKPAATRMASLIRMLGYECDSAKSMDTLGRTTRGEQVKITCGPAGRDEIRWAYRVTMRPNATFSIDPCHVLWCRLSD